MSFIKTLLVAAIVYPLLFCTGGCGHLSVNPTDFEFDRQEEAAALVWNEVYGKTTAPPHIRWITGDWLNCTDPNSGKPGFPVTTPEGRVCRNGVTYAPWQVECAWTGDDAYSGTTMAHEFMHALQMLEGVVDPYHKGEVWQVGGLVELANNKLIERGL